MATLCVGATVLWWHRRAGRPAASGLRVLWDSGISAALVWAVRQVSLPAVLALPGLPATQIAATVKTSPLNPTRACPHLFRLDPPLRPPPPRPSS